MGAMDGGRLMVGVVYARWVGGRAVGSVGLVGGEGAFWE